MLHKCIKIVQTIRKKNNLVVEDMVGKRTLNSREILYVF